MSRDDYLAEFMRLREQCPQVLEAVLKALLEAQQVRTAEDIANRERWMAEFNDLRARALRNVPA